MGWIAMINESYQVAEEYGVVISRFLVLTPVKCLRHRQMKLETCVLICFSM